MFCFDQKDVLWPNFALVLPNDISISDFYDLLTDLQSGFCH